MDFYLSRCGVLIKDLEAFAEELTGHVKAAAYQAACAAGRPVQYLADSQLSKEELAGQIAQRDGIREGLIALFGAVEPCYSFSVCGDRALTKSGQRIVTALLAARNADVDALTKMAV